jgi:hypothetical protein
VAGIQAAKRTPDLVPLCHPLPSITSRSTSSPIPRLPGVRARAEVVVTARTGAEMEALVAVAGALLSIYDMAKSIDRGMSIEAVRLESKAGGRSGEWTAPCHTRAPTRGPGDGVVPSARPGALCSPRAAAGRRGRSPFPRPERRTWPAPCCRRSRSVADTQRILDSLGERLMIVSKRTAPCSPGDPSAGRAGDLPRPTRGASSIPRRRARSCGRATAWYVLDVRDSRAYATRGHLPGAALVPLDVLEANVEDLRPRRPDRSRVRRRRGAAVAAARSSPDTASPSPRPGRARGVGPRGLPVEGR